MSDRDISPRFPSAPTLQQEDAESTERIELLDQDENPNHVYGYLFDREQFIADGNDIRFQLPSNNPDLTLGRRATVDKDKRNITIRRRRSTHAVLRRKSTRPPPVDRSTKPVIQKSGAESDSYDELDSANNILMTSEEQLAELAGVKHLTLSMQEKREYRDSVKCSTCTPSTGLTLARVSATKKWMKMRKKVHDISVYAEVLRDTLKHIEGHFGSGIMEYFKLVKWMIFLNLLLSVIVLFIIVPQIAMSPATFEDAFINVTLAGSQAYSIATGHTTYSISSTTPFYPVGLDAEALELTQLRGLTHDYTQALICTKEYRNNSLGAGMRSNVLWYHHLMDFVQGTGVFENTILFYGYYFNKTTQVDTMHPIYPWYNMSVAYLVVAMVFFIASLFFIVFSTSSGLEQNILADSTEYYRYINKVFAGWEYGLYKEKSCQVKKALLRHELLRDLAEDRRFEQYKIRTARQRCTIYLIRALVNLVVLVILALCGVAIFYTQNKARSRLSLQPPIPPFEALIWEYLPSVLITLMYSIFPIVFNRLGKFEKFYPATELNFTIARIVLLRLATVFLLLTPVYVEIMSCTEKGLCNCGRHYCWETFIGQQVYKLVLLDFFVIVSVVFLVEFPRKLIWKHFRIHKLIATIGQEEFDIPVNVMDIVYTQTLCWVGTFYSPLIPFITLFKVLVFFYVRKLSLFRNQKPAATPYRASSMHLFFMFVLTVSFFLGILAVGISVGVITPSRGCGPFRVHSSIRKPYTMFGAVAEALLTMHTVFYDVVKFLSSTALQVSLIGVLCLLIYIYSALSNGRSHLVALLRDTLKREEKDKRWLLNKVNSTLLKQFSAPRRK